MFGVLTCLGMGLIFKPFLLHYNFSSLFIIGLQANIKLIQSGIIK